MGTAKGGREVTGKKTTVAKPAAERTSCPPTGGSNLFWFEVSLMSGPMPEKYEGKTIARTIEMLGSHTLQDLHDAVFEAFKREEEHLWEFQIGGKRLNDPKNKRYGPTDEAEDEDLIEAADTTLDSLKLKVGRVFGYLFDFGDNWEHNIHVKKIEATGRKPFEPRVVKKIGRCPPQYSDEW